MSVNSGTSLLAARAGLLVLWLSVAVPALAQVPLLPQPQNLVRTTTKAEQYDGPLGISTVGWQAEQYWASEKYAALDEMFARLSSPTERLTDGRWQLAGITAGLSHHFEVYKEWDHMLWQIGEWRETNPKSTAVDIVEATILREWAWAARGRGYSQSVTPEGWKLFKEKLQRAEAVLLRSKDRSSENPLWYDEYLEVALGLGWDEPEYRALYKAAVARFPDYQPFYFAMTRYLLPKWHGSVAAVDAYIKDVVQQTQAEQRKIMYARLYWAFAGDAGEDFSLFEESAANWDDMKSGFEQLMKAYPESIWNLNNFASFACRAGDADTYRRLRKEIGDRRYDAAWPSNFSVDVCDERLAKAI